jgi:hypothetical protein
MLSKIKLVAPIKLKPKQLKLQQKIALRCELPKNDYLKRHIKNA